MGCDIIDEYRYKIIIEGNITNLTDLKDYQKCYLQICKVSDKGTVIVETLEEKGEIFKIF